MSYPVPTEDDVSAVPQSIDDVEQRAIEHTDVVVDPDLMDYNETVLDDSESTVFDSARDEVVQDGETKAPLEDDTADEQQEFLLRGQILETPPVEYARTTKTVAFTQINTKPPKTNTTNGTATTPTTITTQPRTTNKQ